ncbi:uncharacterized protein LOC115633096 [Scaptodrosophila lebanonensis]|uniref:Uncharacterized protein LOC115633096 n=1 Tax=Drosophila lebanonensis TaxID=7225 RepID=A0A6J2UGU5_DROLE|nr:uncharacterized protein LOC115633096 [Scaptodrosophila lebanonensis]
MAAKLRARDICDDPRLVAPLPYLNFLRFFKRKHPRFGLRRLLQEAPAHWDAMTEGQKHLFEKQRMLGRIARANKRPRLVAGRVRHSIYNRRRRPNANRQLRRRNRRK